MLTPLEIKIELLKKGISMREIGRRAGVSGVYVSMVINRKRPARSVRRVIARIIGCPYKNVWEKNKEKAV